MHTERSGSPRDFPPIDQTLQAVVVPPAADSLPFDATIGYFAPAPAADAPATPRLPAISVRFGSAPAPRSVAQLPSDVAPDLEIRELIGEGGMGQVHLARQRSLERDVALKTTKPDAPPTALDSLCEEAVVTGMLEHPSVIPVHAFGRSADGRPVMVMKRIEGVAWKTLLADSSHPAWESIGTRDRLSDHLQILMQVSNALSFAHSRGIVHRDVKPENVMIGSFGEVYLVDWGLALRVNEVPKRSENGGISLSGTPAYMAPEMVTGWAVDARTDVYLLGATLHEILTGEPPHRGETLLEVLSAAYESRPPTYGPDVPEELATLCTRSMARDPADRIASARTFRTTLSDFLRHRSSVVLARRADERLAEATALPLEDAIARRTIRGLLTECRFAYRQALDEWPENPSASLGARKSLALGVQLEIADDNEMAARSLLDAIDDPPADLVEAVVAFEARRATERAEAERLRRLAHDLDTSVGKDARRRVALGIAGIAAIIGTIAVRKGRQGSLTPQHLVVVAGFMSTTMLALVLLMRRRLFRNAFSARIATLAVLSSFVMLVHRAIAVHAGEPIHLVLAMDSLLFTTMLVCAAVTLARWIAWGAAFTLLGAIGSLVFPAEAPLSFGASTVAMLLTAAALWRPESAER